MKFEIRRTSSYDGKPCDEAKEATVRLRWDERTFPTLEEWEKRFPEDFISRTTRKIVRQENRENTSAMLIDTAPCSFWYINVTTMAQLMQFIKKYGEVIVDAPEKRWEDAPEVLGTIEIYDDYRE